MLHLHVSVQIAPCRLYFAADGTLGATLVVGSVILQAVGRCKQFTTQAALKLSLPAMQLLWLQLLFLQLLRLVG